MLEMLFLVFGEISEVFEQKCIYHGELDSDILGLFSCVMLSLIHVYYFKFNSCVSC